MPLQFSELIEREKLYAVSGGGHHKNPLKLATPILYCGGRALATKKKVVAHITVKEAHNLPLPSSQKQDFVLWRFLSGSTIPYDFSCITARNEENEYTHQDGIPLFWEPEKQKKDKTKNKKESKVMYAGHWKLKDSSAENRVLLGHNRCGSLTFSFDHFDENFAKVIAKASQMTVKEIAEYDFAALNGSADENTLLEAKAEKIESNDSEILDDTPDTISLTDAASESESKDHNVARAAKTEWNIKVKAPSPRKRNRENDSATKDSSRATKRSHKIKSEEKVATSIPKSKKKKSRHTLEETPDENALPDGDGKPAASASTPPLQSKVLKDYTRDEIFDLLYEKGSEFHAFAKRLKSADIRGKLIAKQLAKGDDDAFLAYLKDVLGFQGDLIYRVSVMESFKDIM